MTMLLKATRLAGCLVLTVWLSACTSLTAEDTATVRRDDGLSPPEAAHDAAIAATRSGDTEQAAELLEQLTRDYPDYSVAHTDLGLQYLKLERIDAAEAAFEHACELDPGDFVAYNHRGVIMRRRGDFSAAEAMYRKAIRLNPDYANAHYNLAVLYDIYLYDLDQAMQHYRQYQTLAGGDQGLVAKWVVDLERRIQARTAEAQ
jgi:tetratricopeptide (TPR) repeat protein